MFVQHTKIQTWEDPQVFLRIWEENGEVSTIARSRKVEFQVSPEKESWTGIWDRATSLNHTITWAMLASPMQQIHLTMRSLCLSAIRLLGFPDANTGKYRAWEKTSPVFFYKGQLETNHLSCGKSFTPSEVLWTFPHSWDSWCIQYGSEWRFKPLFAVNTYNLRNKTIPKYDFCV